MIAENIQKIRERIAVAAARVSRDPAEITLVCVTKARSIEQIREVISSGLKYIGENRIQEALLKYNQLSAVDQQAANQRAFAIVDAAAGDELQCRFGVNLTF